MNLYFHRILFLALFCALNTVPASSQVTCDPGPPPTTPIDYNDCNAARDAIYARLHSAWAQGLRHLCPIELADEKPNNYYLPDPATIGTCHMVLDLVKPPGLRRRECIDNHYRSVAAYSTALIDTCVKHSYASGYTTFGRLQLGKLSFMANDAGNPSNEGGVQNVTEGIVVN